MLLSMEGSKHNIVIDSSVWIGYFDELDSNHKKATQLMTAAAAAGTIVVTEYVLLEVASVLKRKIGQKKTAEILTVLLQLDNVEVLESTYFFQSTLEMFLTLNEKYLSFVDVSLVVLAKDFAVVTLDKQLAKVLGG